MQLYSIISNTLNILGNNKELFSTNREYAPLRELMKGLGSKKNILSLKNDKPNTIIVSCKKDTKVDDYYLNRLGLQSVKRHDKDSLYIEFNKDVSSLVDKCNNLPNLYKAYKLSISGDDILRAIGGWDNLYSIDIIDEEILLNVKTATSLDEGILIGYGASDIIIYNDNIVRIVMGKITPYLTPYIKTAISKDFFMTTCKYINALGGLSNIAKIRENITNSKISINNMDMVDEEKLSSLSPIKFHSDDRHYYLYLGQYTDIFSQLAKKITANDIDNLFVEITKDIKEKVVDISSLDRITTTEDDQTAYSLLAPITGKTVRLSSVNDEVFSKNVLGEGIAIEPTDDTLYAPFDGIISSSPTIKHALHLTSDSGLSVLLHVGINTIHANDDCFNVRADNNQKVKQGDPLISFDLEKLKADDKFDTVVPIVIAKSNKMTIKDIHYNKNVKSLKDTLFTLS